VKPEPAVKAPESAAAEPTITGACPVFVVVTPSNPHPASVVLAAKALRRIGENINTAHKATKKMAIVKGVKRELDADWVVDLDNASLSFVVNGRLDLVVIKLDRKNSYRWKGG
jgi:hypothetical protein